MFIGISKNVGNGLRIGVGKRIGGRRKGPSAKQIKTKEFGEFLKKVEDELNIALITFVQANHLDYYELEKNDTRLESVIKDTETYEQFIDHLMSAQNEIEQVIFSGDEGVVARRKITESVYTVKNFINKKYPGFTPKLKKKKSMPLLVLFWIGVLFFPYIFSWLTLHNSFSKTSKFIAFSWMILMVIGMINTKTDVDTGKENTEQVEQTTGTK